jgi:hypothetical protein
MLASMKGTTPTQPQAETTLAEASKQASWASRADRQFRPILLGIAALYLAVGVLVGLRPGGGPIAGIALIVVMAGGLAGSLALLWRIRAYTRWGSARFGLSALAFIIWNGVVMVVSGASGWWGKDQPAIHFTISAVIAALPLVVAAGLIGRRRG